MIQTVTVNAASASAPLLASTANDRWVSISVEGQDIRIQYDGSADGSYLSTDKGELVPAGGSIKLDGPPAKNAIFARTVYGFNARVTIQSQEYVA